jgi:hypothetical protein
MHSRGLIPLVFLSASLLAAPFPDEVTQGFKAMEGRHLGTSSYPMGTMSSDVNLGALKGIFETEDEAIQAARVSPGTEALKRAKSKDDKMHFALFEMKEFDGAGKSMNLDTKGGRFVIIEEDKEAEERFKVTGDVRLAVYEANEATKGYWYQHYLRRYDSGTPVKTKLVELPLNLTGIPEAKLGEARKWIAARQAADAEMERKRLAAEAAAKAKREAEAAAAPPAKPGAKPGAGSKEGEVIFHGDPAATKAAMDYWLNFYGGGNTAQKGSGAKTKGKAVAGSDDEDEDTGDSMKSTNDSITSAKKHLDDAERRMKSLDLKLQAIEVEEAMPYDEQKPVSFWTAKIKEEYLKSKEHMRADHWPIAVRRLQNARQYALYEEKKSGRSGGRGRIEKDLAMAEARAKQEEAAAVDSKAK